MASGGVLRHNTAEVACGVLAAAVGDRVGGGWLVSSGPRVVIDRDHVLAAAGLPAEEHPAAAYDLLTRLWQHRDVSQT